MNSRIWSLIEDLMYKKGLNLSEATNLATEISTLIDNSWSFKAPIVQEAFKKYGLAFDLNSDPQMIQRALRPSLTSLVEFERQRMSSVEWEKSGEHGMEIPKDLFFAYGWWDRLGLSNTESRNFEQKLVKHGFHFKTTIIMFSQEERQQEEWAAYFKKLKAAYIKNPVM